MYAVGEYPVSCNAEINYIFADSHAMCIILLLLLQGMEAFALMQKYMSRSRLQK
jgi:hypothetical protein